MRFFSSIERFGTFGPLIAFGVIFLIGMLTKLNTTDSLSYSDLIDFVDSTSAVALAVLAYYGYSNYAHAQNKKQKYRDYLNKLSNLDLDKNEIGLAIQFGGKNDITSEMKEFLKDNKGLSDEQIIISDMFGKDGMIADDDIEVLKEYLIELRNRISKATRVHILYGVVGVGFAVIADILNNSGPELLFYHKTKNGYEVWYVDSKSTPRQRDDMKLL